MNHQERIKKAFLSLEGLSIGDSFGQQFFIQQDRARELIKLRQLPQKPWFYTDDTVMAISIVETLNNFGYIERDYLARSFAQRYLKQPNRGYGSNAGQTLREISQGIHWQKASSQAFSGMGSMGNGGAMRVAPVGAYFYDDYERVVREAVASCEVTHNHPDARAGAIAVAIAAAYCTRQSLKREAIDPEHFLNTVIEITPSSNTRSRIKRAMDLSSNSRLNYVISRLGNGLHLCAYDTVPIALWFVAHHDTNFCETLWQSVSALGDRDTICAIVGSLIALTIEKEQLPQNWIEYREPLVFRES